MFKKLLPHLAALPFALLAGSLTLFLCLWTRMDDRIRQNDSTGYVALVTLITPAVMLMVVTSRFLSFFPKTEGRRLFYSLLIGLVWPALVIAGVFFPELGRIARDEVRLLVLIFLPVLVISYVVVEVLARRFTSFAYTVLALFYLGIPLVYLVENYRGNRAWENAQADIKAKGEILDYKLIIPQPVPDEDNILKAPGMEELFVKRRDFGEWTTADSLLRSAQSLAASQPVLGKLTILPADTSPSDLKGEMASLLRREKERARWKFALLNKPVSPEYNPATPRASLRPISHLSEHPLTSLPPFSVELKTARPPSVEELNAALAASPDIPLRLEAKPTGANGVFDLVLTATDAVSALEYLAWSDTLKGTFDQILAASTRKAAYLHGNYLDKPEAAPIPRFNSLRTLPRIVSDRLQAHLLLGDGPQALKDIEILHAIRRCIASPSFYIVSASIYSVSAEEEYHGLRGGLALHQWQQEDLAVLQSKASKDDHLGNLARALRTESAMFKYMCERPTPKEYLSLNSEYGIMQCILEGGPQGWKHANWALLSKWQQMNIDALIGRGPFKITEVGEKIENELAMEMRSLGPSNYQAVQWSPSSGHLMKRTARAQTQSHLAIVALALERHRLDTGAYPEKLDGLIPKYLAKIPHQVVSADPLLYRKETDGGCTIWSVGWDLKDDNGNPGPSAKLDDNSPDWAWKLPKP